MEEVFPKKEMSVMIQKLIFKVLTSLAATDAIRMVTSIGVTP